MNHIFCGQLFCRTHCRCNSIINDANLSVKLALTISNGTLQVTNMKIKNDKNNFGQVYVYLQQFPGCHDSLPDSEFLFPNPSHQLS